MSAATTPALPRVITLQQDITYFIQAHPAGAEITRQFRTGQVVSDPQQIAELIERGVRHKELNP